MFSATLKRVRPGAEYLRDLEIFHRTLAELCRAEIPLPRAFRLLATDLKSGKLRASVAAMARDVEEGGSLAEAYAKHRDRLPALYGGLIEAGLGAGDLPGVLDAIASHAQRRASISERLRRALRYPLVVAVFVVGIGAFLGIVVAPQMYEFPGKFDAGMPRALSVGVMPYALGALGVLALLVLGVFGYGLVRGRMPLWGTMRQHAERAGCAATLGLLLRRGVSLARAFQWASDATDSEQQRRLLRNASENAGAGASLGECLRDNAVFDPTLTWLVEAADGSAEAPRALEDVAAIYERRLDRSVERAAVFVAPALELGIGVVVLLLTFAFVGPLLEMSSRIF